MPASWHVRELDAHFSHPADAVFDVVSRPLLRPQWQSSLRAVRMITGQEVGVGTRWLDLTWAGARPELEVTVHEPSSSWSEVGTWSGITAELDLRLTPVGDETDVHVTVRIKGDGWQRPLGLGLSLAIPLGLPGDLARADKILGRR
ncbi:MAG: SRPBCC family protein [Nocardioidaceae bacterium]|nr:SRPBCC family protein [Nocardioidaceae bacterium]